MTSVERTLTAIASIAEILILIAPVSFITGSLWLSYINQMDESKRFPMDSKQLFFIFSSIPFGVIAITITNDTCREIVLNGIGPFIAVAFLWFILSKMQAFLNVPWFGVAQFVAITVLYGLLKSNLFGVFVSDRYIDGLRAAIATLSFYIALKSGTSRKDVPSDT